MSAGWRFGEFEFRPDTGELQFRGRRAELQPQPARVLALLLDRRGELVTREELRHLVWGDDVHVEYDQSINFCICQLRRALRDDAAKPRWIETLPRLGYRFVGAVGAGAPPTVPPAEAGATAKVPESRPPRPRRDPMTVAIALSALATALLLATLLILGRSTNDDLPPAATLPLTRPSALRPALAPAALAAYSHGIYFARRPGVENVERGIVELRRAAALAPGEAEPLVELAQALLARHRQGPSRPTLGEAEEAARRAVALAPDLASAQLARADVALHSRYDWDAAEAGYRAALRLDPGLAPAWSGYAALLAALGRLDDAIAAARRAQELDPVCLAASADLGRYLYLARRYDKAIVASRDALALDPRHTLAHLTIIYSHLKLGDELAALAQANAHIAAIFPGDERPAPSVSSLQAYWQGSVEYLTSEARRAYLPPSDLALPRLQLGQEEDGLRLLMRSCEDHAGRDLLFAAVDPRLDAWRLDPRLHRVLACLGLDGVRSI